MRGTGSSDGGRGVGRTSGLDSSRAVEGAPGAAESGTSRARSTTARRRCTEVLSRRRVRSRSGRRSRRRAARGRLDGRRLLDHCRKPPPHHHGECVGCRCRCRCRQDGGGRLCASLGCCFGSSCVVVMSLELAAAASVGPSRSRGAARAGRRGRRRGRGRGRGRPAAGVVREDASRWADEHERATRRDSSPDAAGETGTTRRRVEPYWAFN